MASKQEFIGYTAMSGSSNMANNSLPSIIMNIGETFIPGLGLANNIASTYFQIDLTYYITIAFGCLAICTGISYLFDYAWRWVSPYVMTTAEIRCEDPIHDYLMYWITKQDFSSTTTRFVASVRMSAGSYWNYDDDDKDQNEEPEGQDSVEASNGMKNWDKMRPVSYSPSEGRHMFWHRGRPFYFTRYRDEKQGLWSPSMAETIFISTLGRNTQPIKDLLHEAQIAYHERDGGKTVIYRGTKTPGGGEDLDWTRCLSRPPRPLSTVVLEEVQKTNIINDMKEYLHPYTRKWYSNRGLPYRRGYLFHGPPGTGKTSLCFALAGILNLRIYVVSLNSRSVTDDSLAKLFSDLPWRCIVLLEDIDSAGITAKRAEVTEDTDVKTENKDQKQTTAVSEAGGSNSTNPRGITLSSFLNIIDGVASSEGRILVMTTNHIEKLDPAILRPGRVDYPVQFRYTNKETSKGIFKAIYTNADDPQETTTEKDYVHVKSHSRTVSSSSSKSSNTLVNGTLTPPATASWTMPRQHDKSEDEVETLAEEFAARMPENEFTPAELQGFLLKNKNSPQGAVDGVEDFVETIRREKEVQKKGTT